MDGVAFNGLVEVGPAGPVAATAQGVVMFDSSDRLHVAPWRRGKRAVDAAPSDLSPLSNKASFQLARGPAVRDGVAYWVAHGRLLRAAVGAGLQPPQILSRDARVGTRTAVPVGPDEWVARLPEMVAYVARSREPSAPLEARLWIAPEGPDLPGRRMRLSPQRGVANSVALLAQADGLLAVSLEARTGMSLVHARSLRFDSGPAAGGPAAGGPAAEGPSPGGPSRVSRAARSPGLRAKTLRAGPSEVVWLGGPSRPSTELFAFPVGSSPGAALVALERDIRRFGLAWVDLSQRSVGRTIPARWLSYANGIEPAPVASAVLCRRPVLVLARPVTAAPGARQELVWLSVDDLAEPSNERRPLQLALARRFVSISLFAGEGDGLLVYTADRKTWARTLRCLPG